MKYAFVALALATLTLIAKPGLAASNLGAGYSKDREQVYPEGPALDAVINDMTSNVHWSKVDRWMRAHAFRRINGNLATHNVLTNGGTTRTSMVPFKNDSNGHGAIAVQAEIIDGKGQPTEAWVIWEFWRAGGTVDGNTYVLNGNNFDPTTQPNRTFKDFQGCVTLGCGAAAGDCFITNILDAETAFAGCYVGACGGVIGGCALWAVFF